MKKYLIGAVLSLGILISPVFVSQASAAALTVGQVSAIIGLLQAFGADQSVINNVRIALGGGAGVPGAGTGTTGGLCTYTPPAMPATQGTTDSAGKYHFPPNTHIATPTREFSNGPKSFRPTMTCTIYNLDSTGGVQGAQNPPVSGRTPTVAAYNGNNLRWVVPEHGCISVKFTTGNKLALVQFITEEATIAPIAQYSFNISRNPGDFDYTNFTNNTGGSSGVMTSNVYAVGDHQGGADTPGTAYSRSIPRLETNTTYYLNIRNEVVTKDSDPEGFALRGKDICPYTLPDGTPVGGCGGLFQIRYTEAYRDSSGQIVAGGPDLPPSPNSCPGSSSSSSGPTASFTINGQTSLTNVDPLMSRTWAWSSTGGSSYRASVVISGCDDSRQNGTTNPWTPWTFGSGTAANGSASPTPGAGYYGCTAGATYTVTSSAGQSATAYASVAFKRAGTASGYTCPNGQVVAQASQCPVATNPTPTAGYAWKQSPNPHVSPVPSTCTVVPTVGSACTVGAACLSSDGVSLYSCQSATSAARTIYSGKITDGQGTPLSGAKVSVFMLGPSTFQVDTLTQTDGSWSIDSPYQIAYDAFLVTKTGYEAVTGNAYQVVSGNRFINAGGSQGTWVMFPLGGIMPVISLSPTSGTFNISQSNPAALVFTLTNATRGNLEACYEVVAHPNGSARPGACDTSANFFAFDGNAEWVWNGANLVGTFPYSAAQWGASGIQTKTVFRNKATPAVQTSVTITTTGSSGSSSASGTISASPTSCTIPNGTNGCTTYVTWDTAQATAPTVSARGPSGSDNPMSSSYAYPGWPYRITNGTTTFNLKDGSTLLGSVAVTASCATGSAIIGSGNSNCAPL
ncbi:MAG: carboxypeptidase-like regulatory domain-containing protein [Minisyncoccia bacterium]